MLSLTKEDAEEIRSELRSFMKETLDIGQSSLSNNKQYHAFRKLVFDRYHQHNDNISNMLHLPIEEKLDHG